MLPEMLKVPAEEVARQAVRGMVTGKRSVIPGPQTKLVALGGRYAPRSILLPVANRATRG